MMLLRNHVMILRNKKRIFLGNQENVIKPVRKNMKSQSNKSSRKKYFGVRKRAKKYVAEISDPIRKKKVWLGAFRTAAEAYGVYVAKKAEFDQEIEKKQRFQLILGEKSVKQEIIDEQGEEQNIEENLTEYSFLLSVDQSNLNKSSLSVNGRDKSSPQEKSIKQEIIEENYIEEYSTEYSFLLSVDQSTNLNNLLDVKTETIEEDGVDSNGKKIAEKNSRNNQDFEGNHPPSFGMDSEATIAKQTFDDEKISFLRKLNSNSPIIDNHGSLLGEWRRIDDLLNFV